MNIGEKYKITIFGMGSGKRRRDFRGVCIGEEKEFYILEHKKGFKECFLRADFTSGECRVEEA